MISQSKVVVPAASSTLAQTIRMYKLWARLASKR